MTRLTLDLVGEICPVPLMRTQAALSGLAPGSEVLVETDYPRALTNITHWCFRHGFVYEILDQRKGVYRMIIRTT